MHVHANRADTLSKKLTVIPKLACGHKAVFHINLQAFLAQPLPDLSTSILFPINPDEIETGLIIHPPTLTIGICSC